MVCGAVGLRPRPAVVESGWLDRGHAAGRRRCHLSCGRGYPVAQVEDRNPGRPATQTRAGRGCPDRRLAVGRAPPGSYRRRVAHAGRHRRGGGHRAHPHRRAGRLRPGRACGGYRIRFDPSPVGAAGWPLQRGHRRRAAVPASIADRRASTRGVGGRAHRRGRDSRRRADRAGPPGFDAGRRPPDGRPGGPRRRCRGVGVDLLDAPLRERLAALGGWRASTACRA